MSFDYIQRNYGVPAHAGRLVSVDGRTGVIVEAINQYIGVQFDDAPASHVAPCHPTHLVEYSGIGTPRRLTRSQLRWRRYCQMRDLFPSFREFLKHEAQGE